MFRLILLLNGFLDFLPRSFRLTSINAGFLTILLTAVVWDSWIIFVNTSWMIYNSASSSFFTGRTNAYNSTGSNGLKYSGYPLNRNYGLGSIDSLIAAIFRRSAFTTLTRPWSITFSTFSHWLIKAGLDWFSPRSLLTSKYPDLRPCIKNRWYKTPLLYGTSGAGLMTSFLSLPLPFRFSYLYSFK